MAELKKSKLEYLGKDAQGRDRFALTSSLQAIQYKDVDEQWQDIDASFEEVDADGFSIKYTKTPMLVRVGDDSRRRIYPDKNDLSYWIELKKPFQNMGVPTRHNRWFYWNFPNATIGIRIKNTAIKFGFILKNNQAPTSITIPFETQGIIRQGRFLYHDGKIVAEMRPPYAVDANEEERDCSVVFSPGKVTISLDTDGLVFPITIDPTVDVDVGAGLDDDNARRETSTWYVNVNTWLRIGSNTATQYGYGAGMRFTGVNIPDGATIDIAYIKVIGDAYRDATVVRTDLCCEDSNNPGQIADYADHIGRARTVAVPWDGIATWSDGVEYQSPSIVTPVQAVVDDNAGTGNAIIIFFEDKDLESDEGANREFASFEHASHNPPNLYIEYTAGGDTVLTVSDGGHAHSTDAIVLFQAHTLAVAEALSDHLAESPTLSQIHQLLVANALHGHTVDPIILSQAHQLAVSDGGHNHLADNIILETNEITLIVSDILHSHLVDSPILTQAHTLTVMGDITFSLIPQCNMFRTWNPTMFPPREVGGEEKLLLIGQAFGPKIGTKPPLLLKAKKRR